MRHWTQSGVLFAFAGQGVWIVEWRTHLRLNHYILECYEKDWLEPKACSHRFLGGYFILMGENAHSYSIQCIAFC